MGTTLTGTTPQDTYDSLIKVTDNGPLSGTAKYLSDGLGNDSVLALSNARVGVGTNTPQAPLEVKGSLGIRVDEAGTGSNVLTLRSDFAGAGPAVNVTSNSPLLFLTNNAERMRITSDGYMRMAASTGGIQFNGDTAAANALDDYEEGTFTPTMVGATFVYAIQSGFYTKIGRQVSIFVDLEATYSSPTGTFSVNLPFTVLASSRGEGVVRPITGVTFTNYVTCEAISTSLFFENCFTSTGSASTDMNSTNFNSAGFRFFASITFFV